MFKYRILKSSDPLPGIDTEVNFAVLFRFFYDLDNKWSYYNNNQNIVQEKHKHCNWLEK